MERIDSRRDNKKRMNAEGDRLSNLPDELIYKILSFIDIKQAIETSALSSRWRHLWTSMPYLSLSTKDFPRLPKFSTFVTRFLSKRNDQSEVFSLHLTFWGKASQEFVKLILNYTFSHNVQQVNITCFPHQSHHLSEFPTSLFSSQSLKHLTLDGRLDTYRIVTQPPTWSMPALTTVILDEVKLYDDKYADFFSNCANLKNLTLKNMNINSFSIRHHGLSSLTLERGTFIRCVNVITPQLVNLSIKYWQGIHVVSAPNLSSLHYKDLYRSYNDAGDGPLQLPTNLCHLENVDICIDRFIENKEYTHRIACLLQRLHSVKKLTLNLELVKCFSSVELFFQQPSPLVNLKILKIYPLYVSPEVQKYPKVTISGEVKNYLLDGSPGATLTLVSHEEIRAGMSVTLARNLMSRLQNKLEKYIETSMTDIELDKAPMKCDHVTTMCEQVEDRDRTCRELDRIEALLNKMPTSHRDKDKLQARLSGLRAGFNTIYDHMKDRMKNRM